MKKETFAFMFVAIIFFVIGLSIGKRAYTTKIPDNMAEIPKLQTGNLRKDIITYKDSTYMVTISVDSAIERGDDFD